MRRLHFLIFWQKIKYQINHYILCFINLQAMKMFFNSVFLVCTFQLFSQQVVPLQVGSLVKNQLSFTPFAPFEKSDLRNLNADNLVNQATFVQLDRIACKSIFDQRSEFIELSFPYGDS